jgi:hypothetical protein
MSVAWRRTEARAVRPGNVVPDKKEEANYDDLKCGSEEDGGGGIRPGNIVPDKKEEADYKTSFGPST